MQCQWKWLLPLPRTRFKVMRGSTLSPICLPQEQQDARLVLLLSPGYQHEEDTWQSPSSAWSSMKWEWEINPLCGQQTLTHRPQNIYCEGVLFLTACYVPGARQRLLSWFSQQLHEAGMIIVFSLRKLKYREVKLSKATQPDSGRAKI